MSSNLSPIAGVGKAMMVKLLSSELFAEQLLLDEETGLPKTGDNAELDAKTAVALQAKKDAESAVTTAEGILEVLNDLNTAYRAKTTEVNTLWSQFKNMQPDKDQLNSTPTKIDGRTPVELDTAIDEQALLKQQIDTAQANLTVAEETAKNARKTAEETKEEALELWRETYADYSTQLDLVLDSISYSYYDENTSENVSDLARSFIYVKIAVMNDKDKANEFYSRITKLVPEFVETNMAVPSGYDGTNCQRITRSDKVDRTNGDLMMKTAIKYGLLLAAASIVVACVVLIVVDRSDKRLRNVEQITETFNIPVLGVIPTIQREEEKPAEQKTSTEVQE